MKKLELKGVQKMSNAEMMSVGGGSGYGDLFWLVGERLISVIIETGYELAEQLGERAAGDNYQSYADIGHR